MTGAARPDCAATSPHAAVHALVADALDRQRKARRELEEIARAPRYCFGNAVLEQEVALAAVTALARAERDLDDTTALMHAADIAAAFARARVDSFSGALS